MEYQKFNSEVLEASRRISEMRSLTTRGPASWLLTKVAIAKLAIGWSNHSSYTSRKWPLYPLWGAPMHTYTIPSSMQCFFLCIVFMMVETRGMTAVLCRVHFPVASVSGPFGFLDVNFWSLKRANGDGLFLHSFPFSVVKSWSFYLPLSGRHPRRDELASLRW